MAMSIEGVNELALDLSELANRVDAGVRDEALKAGARVVLEEIKRQATIDPQRRTSNLYHALRLGKLSTVSWSGSRRIELGSYEKRHGQIAPHAHLVEYGHGGPAPAPAHPFIRPAFDRSVDEAYAAMRRVLEEALGL